MIWGEICRLAGVPAGDPPPKKKLSTKILAFFKPANKPAKLELIKMSDHVVTLKDAVNALILAYKARGERIAALEAEVASLKEIAAADKITNDLLTLAINQLVGETGGSMSGITG